MQRIDSTCHHSKVALVLAFLTTCMSEQEYIELLGLAIQEIWAMKQDLDGWVHRTCCTSKVPIELLHRRLGHWSIWTLEFAKQENMYEDVSIVRLHDPFCKTCHVTGSNSCNQGGAKEDVIVSEPGGALYLDIVDNPARQSLSSRLLSKVPHN